MWVLKYISGVSIGLIGGLLLLTGLVALTHTDDLSFLWIRLLPIGMGAAMVLIGRWLVAESRVVEPSEATTLWGLVSVQLKKHMAALSAQKRRKTYTDAYGNEITDQWNEEIKYFYATVMLPHLHSVLSQAEFDRSKLIIVRQIAKQNNLDVLNASEKHDSLLEVAICQVIDLRVRDHERMKPIVLMAADPSSMTASEYEHFCADLLEVAGWSARVQGGSGDQGVDIVAQRDDVILVIQCKLYSSPAGNSAVQEVHAGRSFHMAKLAAVVSNADFTPGARAAAASTDVILLHHTQLEFLEPNGSLRSSDFS